jgi:hypothetical protein
MSQLKSSHSEGLTELWVSLAAEAQPGLPAMFHYRPAVMFECLVEFRDVRAEIISSQDRLYATWLPEPEAAADWGLRAVEPLTPSRLQPAPQPDIKPYDHEVVIGQKKLDEIEADLISHLVRTEKLRVYCNSNLKLFSKMSETHEEFLHRAAEAARTGLEPALRELSRKFKMRLEQLRETPLPETISDERLQELEVLRRAAISRLESRLNKIVLDNPEVILKGLFMARAELDPPEEIAPLFQELTRTYDEAFAKLNGLLTDSLEQVRDCKEYHIGLHPNNIRVTRRALLWVPVVG